MIWFVKSARTGGTMGKIIILIAAAMVLTAGARYAKAEEDLFDTKAATQRLDKGIAELKEKKYDAAIADMEESVSINPDAEAYYYLGYAYYMKGKKGDAESRKKAIECFDKAYELNPGFTPSRLKPAEIPEAKQKPAAQEPVQPSAPAAPSEPAAPVQPSTPEDKTPAQDNPSQPAPPIKATDKVKNIGNVPAVPN